MDPKEYRRTVLASLNAIAEELDEEQYPETVETAAWMAEYMEEPIDAAFALMDCDRGQPMAKSVADLLIMVFSYEGERGNDDALLDLGVLYYDGRAGEQSYEKAVKYYERAASLGNLIALENLGYCHYYGRSIPVDHEKAFLCFVKCALTGMPNALYKAGDMYRYGQFVEKDENAAWQLYRQAEKNLSERERRRVGADVYRRLGDCLLDGIGTEPDIDEALRTYQESEQLFYVKLRDGDPFSRPGLAHVLEMQAECRRRIEAALPQ